MVMVMVKVGSTGERGELEEKVVWVCPGRYRAKCSGSGNSVEYTIL